MARKTILVVSDIHYACAAEQAREGSELRATDNSVARFLLRLYRDFFWLKHPTRHNHLVDQFLTKAPAADFVVANGDFSCNTAFIGVSDEISWQSARECLDILRKRFAPKFEATFGDHELGKTSLLGNKGGMRFSSFERACDLELKPFWKVEFDRYAVIGVTSSLIAFPTFEPETLPEEQAQWQRAREAHLCDIRRAFSELQPEQKVLLFCHDPTALPYLWREKDVQSKTAQIERTIIGHLHSPLFLWKSRILSGMPVIRFLGNSVRRYSSALNEAQHWKHFHVTLCPSLHGIELLKDGGFLSIVIDSDARTAAEVHRHKIDR